MFVYRFTMAKVIGVFCVLKNQYFTKEDKEMSANKILQDYHLLAGIHTISIQTPEPLIVPEAYKSVVSSISQNKEKNPTNSIKLNLNKLGPNIYTYSEFQESLTELMESVGCDNYIITRADLKFDMFDSADYQKFSKLNRFLISMLASAYSVRNSYKTMQLFSQKQLSVAIKNKYMECENYDKEAQSHGHDEAACRLEVRSKALHVKDLWHEFMEHWFARWDKAFECYEQTYRKYNQELICIYRDGKDVFPKEFLSLTDFLIKYQNCIFCKEQMIELIEMTGEVKNPEIRVKNHKNRYGCEFFSEKDIQAAISEIKRATIQYFNQ